MRTATVGNGAVPNERLRLARLRRTSPSGSGRPLSRQELADLVNQHLFPLGLHHTVLDGIYVGKLERGVHRWPQRAYRDAFRAVLGAASDAELGFYITRRQPPTTEATDTTTAQPAAVVPTMAERRALTIWLAAPTIASTSGLAGGRSGVWQEPADA